MTTTETTFPQNSPHALEDLTVFGILYPQVIADLKRALTELNASPFQVTFATTGLGALMNTLIWGQGGCSRTLRNSLFTYDCSSTIELIGRDLKKGEFTIPPTASGMSAAVLFKGYQRLFESQEIDKVPYLIGAAMCGAVQTCRKRNGLDVAQMSLRVLRGGLVKEWTMSLELDKSYSRGWQDILACFMFLNGILCIAGINQIRIPAQLTLKNEVVRFLEDHLNIAPTTQNLPDFRKLIKTAGGIRQYGDHLVCNPEPYSFTLYPHSDLLKHDGAIVIEPDGSVKSLSILDGKELVSVSTSANPLSPLHFLLMREGRKAVEGGIPVLELCLGNPDKGEIDLHEIAARAAQAHGLCHVIVRTGSGKFIDKVAPNQSHVIGIDTAIRILDPKYYGADDATLAERQALVQQMLETFARNNVVFYVVERCGCPIAYDRFIKSQPIAYYDRVWQQFRHLYTGTKSFTVSSTQMRETEQVAGPRS